jgi:hypothetical protein
MQIFEHCHIDTLALLYKKRVGVESLRHLKSAAKNVESVVICYRRRMKVIEGEKTLRVNNRQ